MNVLYGIGIDIVEVKRIQSSLERHGVHFRDRIFTPGESAYCESLAEPAKFRSFAARFAAKEALSKAFHLGIGPAFDWVELEVIRHPTGAPSIKLHGRASRFAEQEEIGRIHISLSHAGDYAVAYAGIECAT